MRKCRAENKQWGGVSDGRQMEWGREKDTKVTSGVGCLIAKLQKQIM